MIQDTVKDRLNTVRGLSTDDILSALGLQRRRTALDVVIPTAGLFVAGLVVGAGVALLIAPKSGRETRRELRGRATDISNRFGRAIREETERLSGGEAPSSRLPDNGGKAREASHTTK
jgi:hypothetical protein